MEDETTMAQEDQTQNCSNGSGGGVGGGGGSGRSSKKPNKKPKVPQRGLGVAQLEKIRLEEQQKKNAVAILQPPPQSSASSTKSSHVPHPIQNFHHSNQQHSSQVPLPCGSPADFMTPLSLQHMDAKAPNTVPLANTGGGGGRGSGETGWPAVSVLPRHGNVPKLWNSHEIDLEKVRFGVDPGLPYLPCLPYDQSNHPIWPLPNLMQRTTQFHQPSSSMVNVSSGNSSTTSVPHSSIEPPSNQNYSNSGVPMRPPEKMIGMKRPYPFSMDFPPVPAFNYKVPMFAEMRTNATTSCGNGSGINYDAGNSTFRQVPSCSASNSEPNSKKSNKESENFNGDFLTLAPPSPTSCTPSKLKSSSTSLAFHHQQQHPEFESPSCQGIAEDQIHHPPPGYSRFNQQPQFMYSFFPPAANEAQIGETTPSIQNCNEVGKSVDLNLKL